MGIINNRSLPSLFPPGAGSLPLTPIQLRATFIVDNCFQLWVGDQDKVIGIGPRNRPLVEQLNTRDVKNAVSVTFNYTPGGYLYLMAWSDRHIQQGLIGQFSVLHSTQKLYSDDPRWRLLPTYHQLTTSQFPDETLINTYLNTFPVISSNAWRKPFAGQANNGAGLPFTYTVSGVDPVAHWVWHNSGSDQRGDYPQCPFVPFTAEAGHINVHGEFLIFAIPLDIIVGIPQSQLPPPLYAESTFADNKFQVAPGDLWQDDDAETRLDFFTVWLVSQAPTLSLQAVLAGRGNGVPVATGPKTTVEDEVVAPATDQRDNHVPNSQAPANAVIKYAEGRVYASQQSFVTFEVQGFVSPLMATLEQEFTILGRTVSLAELKKYASRLPEEAGAPSYNPLLSGLRAMGMFEAMIDRILQHVDVVYPSPPDAATQANIDTLKTRLTTLRKTTVSGLFMPDRWWSIYITYPSYRTIKDNAHFLSP